MANNPMGNQAGNQPEALHAGLNTLHVELSASVSISGGDAQLIAKLPHGAIPVDAIFYPAAQIVMKLGTSASQEMFFGSATYSILTRTTRRQGLQISLSDDMGKRFENVVMVATAGASLGYLGYVDIFYKMPGQT